MIAASIKRKVRRFCIRWMQEHPEDLVHTLRLHYGPETTKKSGNPFHMIHLDEMKFAGILKENFGRVDRIDDCGTPNKYITPYTQKGDNPDLVAWAVE